MGGTGTCGKWKLSLRDERNYARPYVHRDSMESEASKMAREISMRIEKEKNQDLA